MGNGAEVVAGLSESEECRRRLGLHPEIPVLEWDSIEGGFCCNGAPFGSPRFMRAQLDKAAEKFKKAVDVLRRLTRCSVQTRMLLLIRCVHAKPMHLLRGVPPAYGLDFARRVDDMVVAAVAVFTYNDITYLDRAHPNRARLQLALPPSYGGAGLASLEDTYQAAYVASVALCLPRLEELPPLAAVCAAANAQSWGLRRPGPLAEVHKAWYSGTGGPPLASLERIKKNTQLLDSSGSPSLCKVHLLPTKAQRALTRGLADAVWSAAVDDASNPDPLVRTRLVGCKAAGAMDWMRAIPGTDGLGQLDDAVYTVIFALLFGLPMGAVGPRTTCLPTCPRARTLMCAAIRERGWFFGHHFLICPAGKRLHGRVNLHVRHNALGVVIGNMLANEFNFTVDTTKSANQYAADDERCVDMSYSDTSGNGTATAIDFTVVSPWAPSHEAQAQVSATDFLRAAGDDEKIKKHAQYVQEQGANFLPASFSVLGAWGPAVSSWFYGLWKGKMESAKNRGESAAPIVRKMMWWRGRISVVLMRTNAKMILSRATVQGQNCPRHQHGARMACDGRPQVYRPRRRRPFRPTNDADSRVAPLTEA
jgi:hypothetical protein